VLYCNDDQDRKATHQTRTHSETRRTVMRILKGAYGVLFGLIMGLVCVILLSVFMGQDCWSKNVWAHREFLP
jgi:uncharacterized membrane protein